MRLFAQIPMKYHWKIIGHEPLLESLERDLSEDNLAHAYLFVGPEKVGKSIVAKNFAHILQCEKDFCHECSTCTQIEKSCHPDTIEFQDDHESIKIEQIREVLARLHMTTTGRYKIFLAERIERMTSESANCLLKTLEEPPPNTIFLFTAVSLREVLPTIVSRLRVLQFHHCPENILREKMKENYPDADDETLTHVSQFALGKPGVAFRFMRDADFLSFYRTMYQEILLFLESPKIFDRFCFVQTLLENEEKIEDFLNVLTHIARGQLLSNPLKRSRFLDILDQISRTRFAFRYNANKKLTLERLMIHL